jgi:hypothetical protein
MVAALAEKHRFFHWHLAFPEVFADDGRVGDGGRRTMDDGEAAVGGPSSVVGFDVVLGNPPWERIKLQEKEFFVDKAPEIANARTAAKRRKLIKALPERDPALHAAYVDALHGSEALSTYLRESGRFPLSAAGDINTYQVFAGLVRQIVDGQGRVGVVVPTGIATDYYNQDYFAALIDNRELASLYDFENRQGIFPGVHRSYKFSLLTLTGGEAPVEEAEFAFFLHQVGELADEERRFALSAEDLARINPNTKTCPIFRTRWDAELTAKLYRAAPVLVNEAAGTNPWGMGISRLIDLNTSAELLFDQESLRRKGLEKNTNLNFEGLDELWLRLYEGKMISMYNHRLASSYTVEGSQRSGRAAATEETLYSDPEYCVDTRYWIKEREVKNRIPAWPHYWFLCYMDVCSPTNERTMIASIIPYSAPSFSLRVITQTTGTVLSLCALLGSYASFPFDYATRQKVGGVHLSDHIVKQLPVLPPDRYTPDLLRSIVPRVLELTYTAWDLRSFADDVWAEALGDRALARALLEQWEANRQVTQAYPREAPLVEPGWPRPPFTWHEGRRSQLRAELDALYAHLYGLTREELACILETFPIVKRKDEAQYGEYRTKRLVLEAYEGSLKH